MNPTPEERAAGKEDFRAAVGDMTRRDFLMGSVAAGVVSAGSMGAFYFGYKKAEGHPLRVGVLGTGDEGSVLLGAVTPDYIHVKAIADIRPYSIHRAFHGDVYSDVALAARCGLLAKYGWKTEDEARKHVEVYGDYRELIANAKQDGIEAVVIALPLHLHAPAAIAAMRAGLHVLTEKLMGHSVHECKEMARVAKQTGLYLAVGHQRHYNILYHNAMEAIRRGILGDLHYIRAQWHRGNLPGADSWQQPLPKSSKPDDRLAEELVKKLASWERALEESGGRDIEVWQRKVDQVKAQIRDENLDAAQFGYQDAEFKDKSGKVIYRRPAIEELIRWRLWDRTGGGLMAELGSHQLDAASIFVSAMHGGQKQHPLSVVAAANRPLFPPDRDVEDHVYCLIEFPAPGYDANDPINKMKKIGVQYASINGNGFGGYGEIVYGTKGTLILDREKEVMLFRDSGGSKVSVGKSSGPTMDTQASGPPQAAAAGASGQAEVSRGYTEELEHWAWCIRNPAPENQPRCGPKVAMADAIIALTTNIAARQAKRIEFKEEWFDPDSDETPEGVKPDLSRYA
ncbi:MAG: Gfo/Idh/MocA family oxidoreductase [Pirellulales bacterium]|nr:Gfo/Idh/MocA family oxidoreductase [Pirellulales bacterium]